LGVLHNSPRRLANWNVSGVTEIIQSSKVPRGKR
jgi:hypothetical protein